MLRKSGVANRVVDLRIDAAAKAGEQAVRAAENHGATERSYRNSSTTCTTSTTRATGSLRSTTAPAGAAGASVSTNRR